MSGNQINNADHIYSELLQMKKESLWNNIVDKVADKPEISLCTANIARLYSESLCQIGDKEKALNHLQKAVHKFPDNQGLIKDYAVALTSHGDFENALKFWQLFETLCNTKPPSYYYCMQKIYDKKGNLEQAVSYITEGLKVYPDNSKLLHLNANPKEKVIIEDVIKKANKKPSSIDTNMISSLYWHFNKDLKDAKDNFHPQAMLKAARWGYFKWPMRIRDYVTGKRVMDVGCGSGTDSIGFVTFGAVQYVGVDPTMKLDDKKTKNKNAARLKGGFTPKEEFNWTPREIANLFPRIYFVRGTFESLSDQDKFLKFDLITMHTVTEHLINIEEVFKGCAELLSDDGILIYLHHNFYCWNGHHLAPKRVVDIDESDPEQKKYMDWAHLTFNPPKGHYFLRGLNKIRLDDLKLLTEKYFNIIDWSELHNDYGRLTPEILKRNPQYTERELTTGKVYCIAGKKT
ncbi:MAG: methyltransferase domain-containing protein [Limnospira sp. PMC 894.15]|uniref:methyltransferase domain-containing protein n=1 Tax=Limnospira sp. PMC 894.15 TaxID=2981100 RepID=UPI0028E0EB4D|nr:methyltransferase domain-containing protein [Limnospira sp. PMC 894.15]MDT9190221.1 methyltransferase domain-containing protein [Limnospira sp. PMC 894.15]